MLLVREVTGPDRARVGQAVTYRVRAFNRAAVPPAEAAAVSWLAKAADGAALAHLRHHGPALELVVPDSWGGQMVLVMPYMNSPTTRIAVRTEVAAARPTPAPGIREVAVVREGKRFYASVDGEPRFYVGTEVRYGTRRGLMNWANAPGPRYRPEDFEAEHGDWAWYLEPTIRCESRGAFTCLNTYDRARFTFGHLQFAAHTPGDNFVLLLRELLQLSLAPAYFPDLALRDGRVQRRKDGGFEPLESAASSERLMAYFNPGEAAVDEVEAERAARMVDWTVRDPAVRELEVSFAVRQQQRKLAHHATRLPLAGLVDKLVLVVLDILHQGRGSYRTLRAALAADDPFDALLSVGAASYKSRIATLRGAIRDLEEQGRVGLKVYDQAAGGFFPPSGA